MRVRDFEVQFKSLSDTDLIKLRCCIERIQTDRATVKPLKEAPPKRKRKADDDSYAKLAAFIINGG